MKKISPFAAAALLCALTSIASAENLRKVAEANEKAFIHALKTKDISWFQNVAAPGFYEQEMNGKKIGAKESIDQMKQMFGMGNVLSASTKLLKVTPTKGGMIVKVKARMVATMQARGAAKPSKMVDDSTYEERWSKDNGKWMIHSLKTLKDHMTIDGKDVTGSM